ncbi:hypothetical protein RUESEDTHA_03908 [Ruegeria sp. THAF57]|uniref:hypothetical protein n=1 Tax=Ruegeria sp. THAF57 TaxID=2744555 RepID=UPI0015DF2A11|nr:hypothetical protein [Ruegeria sp. THAF57]CAD0186997.1 hypothetical protein RUESEDTHA_03908 [Ruegeria sp. THAF57]
MIRLASAAAAFLAACLAQPWVAGDPVVHVLVQFPLLAAAGYLLAIGQRVPPSLTGPLLVVALTTAAIWMLPRSVDAALADTGWHLAKFVTLPLGFGAPLALCWPTIGPILRGFLKAQSVSMLLFLGFLYTHAPVRICNSYLVDDQVRLGLGFVWAALALTAIWMIPVLFGRMPEIAKEERYEFSRHG